MFYENSQELTNDYEKLFETEEGYDVIIYAGENENVNEICAHSNILRARSQYFRTAFSNKWAEKKGGKLIFKKPNISPQFFKIILRYIYCGKIDLTNLQGPDIVKLLIAVDELDIQSLISCIQECLINHQHEYLKQSSVEILKIIYQHESFTDLFFFYLEKICGEPEILFNSDKFINLNAPLLELILKQDDLNLDEIFIWDSVIKWCLAQNPNISQDVEEWSKEDITIMERIIHRFIPLIRFYDISSEDFISKIFPYKGLLSDNLISDIFIFHMVPNMKLNIDVQPPRKLKFICDSILVEPQHFAIFSSWIEKKNDSHYKARNIPYRFNLLYRASRDSNTPAAFHAKCNNKGATIVIVKFEDSNQLVGGYNPLSWDSGGLDMSTCDSFIFSFTNIQIARVGYSNGNRFSVRNHSSHGPAFGGGIDLTFYNGMWHSSRSKSPSYPKVGIPAGKFNADDYEVFQVTRK